MSKTIIKVENLSKRFRLGLKEQQADTLVGQFKNMLKAPYRNYKRLRELSKFGHEDESVFWALKDINFEVKEGEVLGIIGKNGAGKSTLLKILSQITEPTSGKIELHGRVASLLEVGTGFHPELSGRENIYMNGTILGMTKREIDSKLDEIIDFSGVEKFIDTPVKFYSSGMKVRLGFSVAAHLDPEILIIDEVLAVGDYEFQKKCLGKMEDVSKNQGRTVIFVSHNLDAVSTLCEKSIWISEGKIIEIESVNKVIRNYLGVGSNLGPVYQDFTNNKDSFIRCISIHTSDYNGHHGFGKPLIIEFEIQTNKFIPNATLSFQFFNDKHQAVMHCWLYQTNNPNFCSQPGIYRYQCKIDSPKIFMGRYYLTAHFGEGKGGQKYQTLENICAIEVNMHGLYNERGWNPEACTYLENFIWESLDKN